MPYVIDGDGNCHVYIDASADLDMAVSIVRQRQDAAAERLQRGRELARARRHRVRGFLPLIVAAVEGVELVGDQRARAIVPMGEATEDDFGREFLDLKMSVAVVDGLDAAIEHIARYGSGHTEAIVTRDLEAATRFTREVDAAAVVVNASTRFVDGEELGFGAEIGITTQKLHARGPMGLRELTTIKYVVDGEGQIRGARFGCIQAAPMPAANSDTGPRRARPRSPSELDRLVKCSG